MRTGILFEITQEHLDTGARGIPVGYCPTSSIDPLKGLTYVGRPIETLAYRNLWEVIYLLYHREAATTSQWQSWEKEVEGKQSVDEKALSWIASLPPSKTALESLAALFLQISASNGSSSYREDCLFVLAQLPRWVASLIQKERGEALSVDSIGSSVRSFLQELGYSGDQASLLDQALSSFLVLHLDYSGGDLPAIVAKATSSARASLLSCLSSALCAFSAPSQGGAMLEALEWTQTLVEQLGPQASLEEVKGEFRKRWDLEKNIPGFGSPFFQIEDPRAKVCYAFCESHKQDNPLVNMAFLLRQAAHRFADETKERCLPHLDAISGVMMHSAGWKESRFLPLLAAWARMIGISIQVVYERVEAREGRGVPLWMPHYFYRSI